jgi:ABC-type branched-subunit amino acid transport system substrate-binding protein
VEQGEPQVPKKNWYTTVLGTVALTGGLLAGCSSSTSNGNGANGTNATSQSGGSGKDITIAVSAPFSGNESFIGPDTLNGVKVAVTQINANGGILGKQVRIVTADTAGDPVDAVPAVSQVVSTQHPSGMIGPASLTITAVINQLNQDKLVDMAIGGTAQLDQMNFPYIFRVTPSDTQMAVGMAYYGIEKGYKRAALVFGSNASAQTLAGPVQDTLTKHGSQVEVNLKIVPDQSSYRSEIEKLLAAKPDVMYMQLDPQTGSTFFSELQQLGGGNIPVIGDDVTASAEFAKAIGLKVAQKTLTSVQGSTVGGTAADEYAKFYASDFNGDKPVILSNNGYDSMNIIALAMLEAKSTDPTQYVQYITKVANGPGEKVYDFKTAAADIQAGKAINYEGASGPDDFNQYHNTTGAFEADKFTSTGALNPVESITPEQLMGY